MTFELLRPGQKPSWSGVLPGAPEPYFLKDGEGEHSQLYDTLVTVLLSADETEGQFGVFTCRQPKGDRILSHKHADVNEIFFVREGAISVFLEHRDGRQERRLLEPGDFAYVPAGIVHSYRAEAEHNVTLGVSTGGFERFFQALGALTDHNDAGGMYVPPEDQFAEAFAKYSNIPVPDLKWTV
jgi:quercetin 2,3-dioxygenase